MKNEMIEVTKSFKEMTTSEKKKFGLTVVIAILFPLVSYVVGTRAAMKTTEIVDEIGERHENYSPTSLKSTIIKIVAGLSVSIGVGSIIGGIGSLIIKKINS